LLTLRKHDIQVAENKHLGRESTMADKNTAVVSEEKIREIAHQLWVEAGQPDGQAESHWFKAIEQASAKAAKKAAAPVKVAAVKAPAPKKAAAAKKAK
jgi:Protein of unknown function (DUF2934)